MLAALAIDASAQTMPRTADDDAAPSPPVSQLRHLMLSESELEERPETNLEEVEGAYLLPEGPIDPETYPVGPGDQLTLVVWGAIEVTVTLPVSAEGRLFVPNVGMIDVKGLSLAATRTKVIREVRGTYNNVNVDLVLARMRQFKVHVVGGVWSPGGSFAASPITRVSEVIRLAGGVIEVASTRRIVMHLPDGSEVPVDLAGFELTGRLDLNPPLVDGAVVEVPRRSESVLMSGEVVNPGTYEPIPGERLSALIDAIGGFRPSADTERIVYSHFINDTEVVEREIAFNPGTDEGDPVLVNGDRVFVRSREGYHANAEVYVYGAVNRPGRFPIPITGRRLSEVLASAGGVTSQASLSQAHILRPAERYVPPPEEPIPQTFPLDRSGLDYVFALDQLDSVYVACDFAALLSGDAGEDVTLFRGDVIHVPESRAEVRVIGYVKRPGSYAHVEGRSVGDYVDLAGGFDKDADKGRTRVAAFAGGPLRRPTNDDVANGTVIYVPAKSGDGLLRQSRDLVSVFVQIASLVLIIDRLAE